jgi:hypothetical protein
MLKSIGRTLALRAFEEIRMANMVKKTKTAASEKTAAKPNRVKARKPKSRMVSHEEIERLAHQFWMERGNVHGQAEIDWFRAEQALRGRG